ncbi:flagellar biosynthesis repressor FlbT [Aureimonas populi]|uniref:Probable flagellum biosynthesis repressor protein FlbT n=1 Tax=Aureimonas populi TaxID=1701758 RepID=A0ABW5CJU7_9HYPH|nr:flagellar biosynthesis repressor FlbT [Aureimonas populi]
MSTLKLSLKAGERIFINGAVMRVDRRTQLEILNDVTFLLESHVMQAADTRTPLRQLYFIVQMMLIDPANAVDAKRVFESTVALLLAAFETPSIRDGLAEVEELVQRDRPFDALKRLRALIPMEDRVLANDSAPLPSAEILPLVAGAAR